jgi:hypothetical protein
MRLLGPEEFQPWVGRKVQVNTLPEPTEVRLDRIELSPRLGSGLDFRQPFTLFFSSPLKVYLLDMGYEFDCGRGGPHTIVISQLPPLADMRIYQAIFN